MSQEKIVIDVRNLTIGYDDRVILENLTFQVKSGEIFIILGGSGCGKSTLLKNLIGLYPIIGGEAFIDGDNIATAGAAEQQTIFRKIGVTYQSGALFGSMTLLENVMLPLEESTNLPPAAREMIAAMKLRLVNLQGFEYFKPAEISGGMQKRAAMARAMALDPRIMFLDEPSAGLDPITSAELDALIKRLAKTLGMTFVIVTHELDSVFAIADRCIFLDKETRGILATGRPEELKTRSPVEKVRRFFNREISV